MAEAGLGVGIVPQDFIRTSDRVRTIELDEPLPPRAVCIVKRKGHPLSVAARELERILDYMAVLDGLDTAGTEPLSHVFPLKNVLRPDETAPSADRAALLAGAPAADGESFLVPKAVE